MAPPPAQLLAGIRLGVGVGAWAAPNLTGRVFGLDAAGNPQMAFMARLFGARDVALAVSALRTAPRDRALTWQVGVACDLADAVAAYLGARNGTIPRLSAVLAGTTALTAAGLGVAALQADAA